MCEHTSPAFRAFVESRRVMTVATVRADGAPLVTPVWFVFDRGSFFFYSLLTAQKVKNIRGEPRTSVVIEAGERAAEIRFAIMRGRAEVVEDRRIVERAVELLLQRYEPDLAQRWGQRALPPDRCVVRFSPETTLTRGVES